MIEIGLPDEFWKDIEPGTEALADQWMVKEGDRVNAGQVVARVVLVKTTLDVNAPASGVIERILVPAEQTFAKGKPLATMREG
jgi:pyruvate/2-oxoglutarate dehydrogenase complex dihydrolipoamide acyltransferase (E2) component